MPFKMQKTMQRIVSFMLVVIMMIGMLPAVTFPADAAISVPGAGNNTPNPSGGSQYGWTFNNSYGAFTRISLLEITADDDDSMSEGATTVFSQGDNSSILNACKVLGTIDIGSADAPPTFTDSNLVWFDTNAIEYTRRVNNAGQSNTAAADAAVTAYLNSSWKEGWTEAKQKNGAPRYLSWQQFTERYVNSPDVSSVATTDTIKGEPIPSWLWKFTDPDKIFGCYGDLSSQGDVTITASGSHVLYRSEERRAGKECRSRWSPYH